MKRLSIICMLSISISTFAMQSGYERSIGSLVSPEDKRRLVTIMSIQQIHAKQTIVISEDGYLTYAKVTVPPCEKSNIGIVLDFKAPRGRAINFNNLLRRSYLILDTETTK